MTPLRTFAEYVKQGTVSKITPDNQRAKSLAQEAKDRKEFFAEMHKNIPLTDKNANYFIENAYDILLTQIRSIMLENGYNAAGEGAHEAEISYLAAIHFSESDVRFANQLRYFRNGILYYGKKMDATYAQNVIDYLEKIYPKLQK